MNFGLLMAQNLKQSLCSLRIYTSGCHCTVLLSSFFIVLFCCTINAFSSALCSKLCVLQLSKNVTWIFVGIHLRATEHGWKAELTWEVGFIVK